MLFRLYALLLLTTVLSTLTAIPIDGFIYTHEENVKHRPHHTPRRNEYQGPQQLAMNEQILVLAGDEQTPEQLSHLALYCPVCKRIGRVEGGKCITTQNGYHYLISHNNPDSKCILVQQNHRDEILYQIKKQAYKKDISYDNIRYLMTVDKEILEDVRARFQSRIKKDDFYYFNPS